MRDERRLAAALVIPACAAVAVVAVLPVIYTGWESLHRHDLRMPWLGRPFVGLANYSEMLASPRFGGALLHTLGFTAASLAAELTLGLALALVLDHAFRGRALARVAVLLPWAIPSVVAALVWRFIFEADGGIASGIAGALTGRPVAWLADPWLAWVPIVLADVWKTTPFVALLLLAGLQTIDPTLYEAARIDGAGRWRQLTEITLPLLGPALGVAALFRALDALRVFDVVYVLTGGGPGTATEPVSIYAFDALLRNLRFGYGSAISMTLFLIAFALALVAVGRLGSASARAGETA